MKTIHTITSHVNSLKLQAAGVKSFIPDCRRCPRQIAKPAFRAFTAANVGSLGKLGPLIKELEALDSGCISYASLRRRRQLMEGVEEVAGFFDAANMLSRFFLRRLLYFAMAIFFCFPIASTWGFLKI